MRIDEIDRGQVFEAGRGVPAPRPDGHAAPGFRRARGIAGRAVAIAALLAAGVWAWSANRSSGPAMDMSMRVTSGATPFPVTLASVERGPVAGVVVYTGSVAPLNEEDVFPRVTGRIVEMAVYPGDAVRAGQVVARLDDIELGSRAREAEAGAAAAAATAAQMEADVVAARQGVVQMERELVMVRDELRAARNTVSQMENELTMAQAEAGYQEQLIVRDERLYRTGAIALQEVEATRAAVTGARAKAAGARARVDQMKAMVAAGEAKVEAAGARLDQAKAMEQGALRRREAMGAMASQSRAMQHTAEVVRDYVNIRSPSGGYVVKRLVAPGVLVQPGMAILKIAQIDRVRLQANVGEKDLASIEVGSSVRVTPAGTGQAPITARVTSVFPFVDPGARTGVVEALVDNAGRRFLPGQYVQMQFVTGERSDALTVPVPAVTRLGGQATVWVVEEGRAAVRAVTTGLESGERIEIRSGLAGGERVIVTGHGGLYAGAPVRDVAVTTPGTGHAGHGPAAATNASDGAGPGVTPGAGHAGHGQPPTGGATGSAGPEAAPATSHAGHGQPPSAGAPQASGAGQDMPGMPGMKQDAPADAPATRGSGHAGH